MSGGFEVRWDGDNDCTWIKGRTHRSSARRFVEQRTTFRKQGDRFTVEVRGKCGWNRIFFNWNLEEI